MKLRFFSRRETAAPAPIHRPSIKSMSWAIPVANILPVNGSSSLNTSTPGAEADASTITNGDNHV